ncbi:MAG: pyridoxal-phosphate dependent enzyme [Candidatus Dormiibacterota bacterium]
MSVSSRAVRPPDLDDLERAWATVSRALTPTPLLPSGIVNVALKAETLQPTGSFKVRGALAALGAVPPGRRAVTASAGNHALGVAEASRRLGVGATVVVPETASPAKVDALRGYDVELVQHGVSYDAAEAFALRRSVEGDTYVSPYNDPLVIAGQATIGAELARQVAPGPLTVVCAAGGGGLCAGLGLWASTRPHTKVVGVEALASRALSAAVAAGAVVEVRVEDTLADGLAGNLEPGSVTPSLIAASGVELLAVTEGQIAGAMRWAFSRQGLVLEGAAAAPLAAVLDGMVAADGQVVVVLSGRNIAPARYAAVLSGGR